MAAAASATRRAPALSARLLGFVVAVSLLFGFSEAQSTAQQISNTTFAMGTQCVPNANSYVAVVNNGFVTPTTFVVELNYQGSVSSSASFVVPALGTSLSTAVGPAAGNGGVANRPGFLNLIATNPDFNAGNPGVIQSMEVFCGGTVLSSSNCDYVDPGCLIDRGWFFGNAFNCLIFFNCIIFGVLVLGGLMYWLFSTKNEYKRVILPKTGKRSASTAQRRARPEHIEEQESPQPPSGPSGPKMTSAEYQYTYGAGSPYDVVGSG